MSVVQNLNVKVGLFTLSASRQHKKCAFPTFVILTSLALKGLRRIDFPTRLNSMGKCSVRGEGPPASCTSPFIALYRAFVRPSSTHCFPEIVGQSTPCIKMDVAIKGMLILGCGLLYSPPLPPNSAIANNLLYL